VYSVGVLLYELLSLELPFGNLGLHALMQRVLTDEPQPLRSRCRVSRPLSAIVSKAIARNPAARYKSAKEFAADLEAFVQGNAVSARPSSAMGRLPRLARRHAVPLVTVLTSITLLTLALVVILLTHGRKVLAAMDPDDMRDVLESALLWDFAERPSSDESRASGDGSEHALARLEARARDDHPVLFPRAHVHLAVVAAERGEEPTALRHLAELEAAGWEYEAMQWVRDRLDAGKCGRSGGIVGPSVARTPDSTGNDVDRYYLVRRRALGDGERRFSAPVGLEKHPIYAAPVLFLTGLRETGCGGRDFVGTIEILREVQGLAPNHPVVETALLRRSCEQVRAEALQGEELEKRLAPLQPSSAATAETQPTYASFWSAYGDYLRLIGDASNARGAFARALEIRPGDPRLLGGMAHACLDELELTQDQTAREQLVTDAITMLVEAVGKEPAGPESLSCIEALQQITLSPDQTRLLTELQEKTGGQASIQVPR
jgi:hypothetical protein